MAPEKSEAVVLTKNWKFRNPEFVMDGYLIPVKPSIIYLGVQLDSELNFTEHVKNKAVSARKSTVTIGRLMPNVQSPVTCKRWLLMSVVNSKLLYAALISRMERNRLALTQTQRIAAIRVARCYRTVSDMAARARARENDLSPIAGKRAPTDCRGSSWVEPVTCRDQGTGTTRANARVAGAVNDDDERTLDEKDDPVRSQVDEYLGVKNDLVPHGPGP